MSGTLIATGPIPPFVCDALSRFGRVQVMQYPDEATLAESVSDAIALLARSEPRISRRVIDAAPRLRMIARSGVGCDNVDLRAASDRKIPVLYTPGAGSRAVAEGALAMILALAKRLPELDRMTKDGQWAQRMTFAVGDLRRATLGIVGVGRIGSELAKLAMGLEMRVLGCDPYLTAEQWKARPAEPVDLDVLLRESDYVSLHTPLTDETRGLLDRRRLEMMKHGAVLVNTARGGVISSLDDLHSCLLSGRLSAVGLDVFPDEPPSLAHALFTHPGLLAAPHAVGYTRSAEHEIFTMLCDGTIAILEGRPWPHIANAALLRPLEELNA